MILNAVVQPAPPFVVSGFDTDTVVTAEVAKQFAAQGYKFCLRYLSLGGGQRAGDLSTAEAEGILAAGLALMAVQHVPDAGWSPLEVFGRTAGGNAAANARQVGLPPGVSIWCDLEGVDSGAAASDVIEYCNAWCFAVAGAGYVPGLYVGPNCGLDGQQLYDLAFSHYWKSASHVPSLPARGYQMLQSLMRPPVNGIFVDEDVCSPDTEGGCPQWLIAASPP